MIRSRGIPVFVAAALILLPSVAAAQEEPTLLTWAGTVNVKPGAGPLFEKAFDKYNKPLFDQLVADGKVTSWAMGYELAGPGGYDYVIWITAPWWAGIGEVEAAFVSQYEGLSEEEIAEMIEDWAAAIEPGDDQTFLLRHKVFNANPDTDWKFLRLSYHTVKPGHGGDLMKMYKTFWVPIYDQLMETGAISGYGMAEQAVHSDGSFTHQAWITFNALADLDKVDQAIEKAFSEMSAGDEVARKIAFMKTIKPDTHFDRLIRVWKRSE
ncbi:MAG: hypothetical protein EP299_06775 [Acidobacteria bacterium]|nr:MAG: hypothetical protein EP299_06775 [Acidobacteriota bacterium]